MPARRLRAALAAALAAPLLVGPVVAEAVSVPLTCGGRKVAQTGLWQRLPVEGFRGVPGVTGTRDVVTAYSVDAVRPDRLLATNGNTVKRSTTAGCTWKDVLVLGAQGAPGVPLSGSTSTVVATASLPGGPSLAAVREGTSAASRPHVVSSSDGGEGSWRETSGGLPAQGSPRLLEPAGDGRTAYLTISPATDAGGSGGTLPTLPGVGGAPAGPAGFLFATTDGGRTWAQRGSVASLPSGASGFDALAVDPADPELLYAVSDGRLVVSRDGGRTLSVAPDVAGVTAVEPMEAGEVAVLAGTTLLHSRDGGRSFAERPAPVGAGSAAYRKGDGALVVEADGALFRVEARAKTRGPVELDAGVPATAGSARGTRSDQGSFSALAGHDLLRFVDPVSRAVVGTPRAPGDLGAPPPPPGRMDPPSRSVVLPVGESRVVDFTLVLPKSPTPLDLYLLVDVSQSMGDYIADVKANLEPVAGQIAAQGIDLRVGIGTVAAGPRAGERPYPDVDPSEPRYRKPDVYKRVRQIGEVNADLRKALSEVAIQTPPSGQRAGAAEGQLIGLDQLVDGLGIVDDRLGGEARGAYVVPPGQQAGFRDQPGIRRIVALATDENFTDPYGTRLGPDGKPDIPSYAQRLRAAGIKVIGLTAQEGGRSKADLITMARLTGTFTPPGGVDCGDEVVLKEGEPLVCDSGRNFTQVLGRALQGLADRQSVALVRRGPETLLGDVDASGLRDLDVTVRNDVPFRVRVSCVDVAAGKYAPSVDAVLRDTVVATAKLAVTCTAPVAAAAAQPPKPPAPAQDPVAPAGQPAAQAPPPPAPAPPVVQPQAQPQAQAQTQVQAQVNPMTAAMLQQQEELQLALALSSDERLSPGGELAMVDRQRSAELRALALLSVSMAAASTLGLARLRTRRADAVRVRRSR